MIGGGGERKMRHSARTHRRQLVEIVAEASRLVNAQDGVQGVHIVAQRRPTYRELLRYQNAAREGHAGLTVDGHGLMSIRPERY